MHPILRHAGKLRGIHETSSLSRRPWMAKRVRLYQTDETLVVAMHLCSSLHIHRVLGKVLA